jgi:DNA invertase Pin-like site-specific DNA recombinase
VLEELRPDAKGHVYDAMYFHSADRLARKAAHQTIIVDELLRSKKQVVIGGKDFVRNPENTLTLTMLGAFAEFKREKIIERTTRGWRHRIRSGGVVSQGTAPSGSASRCLRSSRKSCSTACRRECRRSGSGTATRVARAIAIASGSGGKVESLLSGLPWAREAWSGRYPRQKCSPKWLCL